MVVTMFFVIFILYTDRTTDVQCRKYFFYILIIMMLMLILFFLGGYNKPKKNTPNYTKGCFIQCKKDEYVDIDGGREINVA
jgi:glycerol uptake facilitator-like aquaporin